MSFKRQLGEGASGSVAHLTSLGTSQKHSQLRKLQLQGGRPLPPQNGQTPMRLLTANQGGRPDFRKIPGLPSLG